jgi:hypothetical protein
MDLKEENLEALRRYPVCQACNDERSCAVERRAMAISAVLCDPCSRGEVHHVEEPAATPDFVPRTLTMDPGRIKLVGQRLLEARLRARVVFGRLARG